MPFARPTLAELVARARDDLRGGLEIDGPILRRAMVDILGAVLGGMTHLLYGFLEGWVAKQFFATTAGREFLLRIAAMYGITPTPAQYAAGNVVATGADGSTIDTGTILRLDDTTSYRVTSGGTIDLSGQVTLPVQAVLAGEAGNLESGAGLAFQSPITGVNASATASGDIDGGEDEEGPEEVRARLLLRLRKPPEGGADQDYEAWAIAVAGVTRAWVYEHELGLGTVVVRFVRDGDADIIPDVGEVAAVQAKLDAERPMAAEVTAMAPDPLEVDFTIHLVPDNSDTRAAVEAELADLLRRVAEPGNGSGRGTVLLSQIRTAIGVASGVTDYTLTLPSANVVPGVGELAVVGGITFT